MFATSELILRYCSSEPCSRPGAVLLINPPRDSLAIELQRNGMSEVSGFSQDFGDASCMQQSGINCEFGLLPQMETPKQTPEQTTDRTQPRNLPVTVILFLPREKERLEFLLHFIAEHLPGEGQLWLVGENKAGIKSAEARLKQRFSKVQKRDAARHCVLYLAQEPMTSGANVVSDSSGEQARLQGAAADSTGAGIQAQLRKAASDSTRADKHNQLGERALLTTNPSKGRQINAIEPFSPEDYLQQWTLPSAAGEIHLQSLPGAFAHGRLDKGTALLLDYMQNADHRQLRIKGKVLDFGCGAGVIGIYLKRRYPDIELDMLDSSALALESTRLSLARNGCVAQVTASDGLDAAKGRYDWIISNPPFHKGVTTDFDIARRFISTAPAKLGNRGRMLLVCNRHLPYEAWLTEAFVGFEKVAENRDFKVLQAHGPRR